MAGVHLYCMRGARSAARGVAVVESCGVCQGAPPGYVAEHAWAGASAAAAVPALRVCSSGALLPAGKGPGRAAGAALSPVGGGGGGRRRRRRRLHLGGGVLVGGDGLPAGRKKGEAG